MPAVVESLHQLEAQSEASMLTVLHAASLAGEEKTNNIEASVCITDIYEGTQQIQHLIIARAILGYGRKELS